jgi:protoheme IX farnesyltransferase
VTPAAHLSAVAPQTRSLQAVAADVLSLTKPRLSSLVMFTAAGGLWLSGAEFDALRWSLVMLGTWGTVGAANALNCWFERESDKYMARTANRPLPAGRMDPAHALTFGLVMALVSLPLLAVTANLLTAVLGATALVSYVLVYTPLKPRTGWAMLAGSLPGALPPLMGWTAGTNALGAGGLALFAILFLWQLPHFLAISLYRKNEYRAAGLASVAISSGDDAARIWSAIFSAMLLVSAAGPYFAGVAGAAYLGVSLFLSGLFLAYAIYGAMTRAGPKWARQYFLSSLLYLVGVFVALGLDRALS